MQVQNAIADFGRKFADVSAGNVNATPGWSPNLRPSDITVSTMTLTCILDAAIELPMTSDSLVEAFGKAGIAVQAKTAATTKFLNQTTLKYNKVSIKVFRNGSLQLTGIKSMMHFADVTDVLFAAIEAVTDVRYVVEDVTVCLINATIDMRATLPLLKLKHAMDTSDGCFATYDPDKYPGLNVKHRRERDGKNTTALVFKTGKCILTGAREPDDILTMVRLLCKAVDDIFRMDSPEKRRPRRINRAKQYTPLSPFRSINGYERHDYELTTQF